MKIARAFLILSLLSFGASRAEEFGKLCTDRAALERVYHAHRIAATQPFEQAMPRELIEKLVRQDQHKEAVLRNAYGVEITPAMVAAEVQRIDATTRAPEMLAEIKHALGDDAKRFALSMARPIIVERELRRRFDNDDQLHAAQRREAEHAREAALAAGKDGVEKQIAALSVNKAGAVTETTWQLAARPDTEKSEIGNRKSEITVPSPQTKGVAKSGAYSVEATAQIAQTLTPPPGELDRKFYFEDLDPELQKVLRVQLQKPGDVSAVIETPGAFLLFAAKEKSAETLSAASLSIPKRSYEEWLAQQPEEKP